MWDVAVVGGGAAGLMAAIWAAKAGASVIVLEHNDRVGKKILATGNGRCNMTNRYAAEGFEKQAHATIDQFPVAETLAFFEQIGLMWREEDEGRIYPYCGQAAAVLDVLRRAVVANGITVRCGYTVDNMSWSDGWDLGSDVKARKVILAAGGKASHGNGPAVYGLLTRLGCNITPLRPALTPLRSMPERVKAMSGLRLRGRVELWRGEQKIEKEMGEILFTDYGLSGIPILQLSRFAMQGDELRLGLIPEMDEAVIFKLLCERRVFGGSREDFFTGWLPKRVGQMVMKSVFGDFRGNVVNLGEEGCAELARTLCNWRFPVMGLMDWGHAQITAGGVSFEDLDETLQCKRAKGVWVAGELVDVDGPCGGYNLQWAWSSGAIAGQAAGFASSP